MQKTVSLFKSVAVEDLPTFLLSTAIRIVQWIDDYHSRDVAAELMRQFDPVFPTSRPEIDRELCTLLSKHGSEQVVRKTLDLLATEPPQQASLHYLMVLSKTKQGWSVEDREEFFRLIEGARLFQGDEGLPEFVIQLQQDALSLVPADQRERFERMLKLAPSEDVERNFAPRTLVQKWSPKDFGELAELDGDRTIGSRIFQEAQCAKCHRLGRVGR